MDIRNIGSVLHTDENGYIVKVASVGRIQPKWRPAVDMIIEACKSNLGNKLHSVYVRGSAARGEAIDGVSDIDTIVLIAASEDEVDKDWCGIARRECKRSFPFVRGVEIKITPVEGIDQKDQFMLKTQAACVYGQDITERLPRMKPGREAVKHAFMLHKKIDQAIELLQNTDNTRYIREVCTWIMKRIVRSGCELVMERSGKYTRDLYPCYELFSQYYPEKSESMYRALELAVNPTEDVNEIMEVLQDIGAWIVAEVPSVFEKQTVS